MAKRKKKWMGKARARMEKKGTVGAFTAWCKSRGYDSVTDACIQEGLRAGGKTAKRAAFAKAARKVAGGRKKKKQ